MPLRKKRIYNYVTPCPVTDENTINSPRHPKNSPKLEPPDEKDQSMANTLELGEETSTTSQLPKPSGIPLRMKSGSTTPRGGAGKSYRHPNPTPNLPVINKNTLEVQFMNNKKRLLQLHAELVEKQRPLIDIHKSLLRTKRQLGELGKKVVLEDIKIISLTADDGQIDNMGDGETMAPDEAAAELKTAIGNVIAGSVEICHKCFLKNDDVVKMLEGVSQGEIEPTDIAVKKEDLNKQKLELEDVLEKTIDSQSSIEELMNLWQTAVTDRNGSAQLNNKVMELEEMLHKQQKLINDADQNVVTLNRKFNEKKLNYEKQAAELQEKILKLEDDLKKEKKNANDNLMKSRTLRSKLGDSESKTKEADERVQDANTKLKQAQEQLKKKESLWLKERDGFIKNDVLLQHKLMETQSHYETRIKDMAEQQKASEMQQENFFRSMEAQLEVKEQELLMLERERDVLGDRSSAMEEQIAILSKHIEDRDKEIEQLSMKTKESMPALDFQEGCQWEQILQYQKQISEVQENCKQQNDQILQMQSSLKAHSQLAVALKLEKDNAIKYSKKLREILQEARDEIEYKNRTIYKVHEKLVLREAACEKLKDQLTQLEELSGSSGKPRKDKNRCHVCMSMIGEKTDCSFGESSELDN